MAARKTWLLVAFVSSAAGAACGGRAASEGPTGDQVGGAGGSAGTGGVASTGGDDGGVSASCSDVKPCGGDVVGTWTVIDSCLQVNGAVNLLAFGLSCSSAPTAGTLDVTGTWSADAAGMVSDRTTTTGNAEIEVPVNCSETLPATCAQLGRLFVSIGYASVACADSESAWCDCSADVQQNSGMALISLEPAANGTYTTGDGVLTVSERFNDIEYSYCVSGDTMTLTPRTRGHTGTVTGTIVLQKQ